MEKPAVVTPDPSYWKARGEATMGSVYFKSLPKSEVKPDPERGLVIYEAKGGE